MNRHLRNAYLAAEQDEALARTWKRSGHGSLWGSSNPIPQRHQMKKQCQEPRRPCGTTGHRTWLSVGCASLPLAGPQQPWGSQRFGEACTRSGLLRVSAPSAEASPLLAQSLAALPSVPPQAGWMSCWQAGCCAHSHSCHSHPPGTRGTRIVVGTYTERVVVSPVENERVHASVQIPLGSCSAAWAIHRDPSWALSGDPELQGGAQTLCRPPSRMPWFVLGLLFFVLFLVPQPSRSFSSSPPY